MPTRKGKKGEKKSNQEVQKRPTGPERWDRWAEMLATGMKKSEIARAEGVSRAAVTMGLRKLRAGLELP